MNTLFDSSYTNQTLAEAFGGSLFMTAGDSLETLTTKFPGWFTLDNPMDLIDVGRDGSTFKLIPLGEGESSIDNSFIRADLMYDLYSQVSYFYL